MDALATGNEGSFNALTKVRQAPYNWLKAGPAAVNKTPCHVVAAQLNISTHGDQTSFDAPATEYERKAAGFSTGHQAPTAGITAAVHAEFEVAAADLARLAEHLDTVLAAPPTATFPRAA